MAISNTTIQIKKSGAAGNVPSSLNFGELALNYYDGKLYYKNTTGNISYFYGANNGPSFATANANNNLILASTPNDTLSFLPANGITISACTTTKTITIGDATTFSLATGAYAGANAAYAQANAAYAQANAASATSSAPAFTQANSAYTQANAAFIQANAAFTQSNTYVWPTANLAYAQANAAFIQANAAFTAANTASGAAAAFTQANAAFAKANTAITSTGGTITGNVTINANVSITNTTNSISNTTGALVISGGLGVTGNIFVSHTGVVGFSNTITTPVVYMTFNNTTASLDTIFI
jgi:hypothetical protein